MYQFAGARAASRARHSLDARERKLSRLREEDETRQCRRSAAKQAERKASIQAMDIGEYLNRMGYIENRPSPEIAVAVLGHAEEARCTVYELACAMRAAKAGAERVKWVCKKRLCELREELHDPLKEALGSEYAVRFSATPFARHGGLPGTTARLRDWFKTLSDCLSGDIIKPQECALVLQFLDTPLPSEEFLRAR
mmetsp:Transcript_153371/g.278719  ORF Transcript_153371/g.278719 Transcript_153371/m.278719 type:complete len:196 (-) Transcript_153371:91-678(-)